ncbi:hypothetical protein FA13DRAFT_1791282 [Coprinellus micaceus]|uniref:Uncharacterized protein n=1 Tax=Coprinellus micaceus TaxID=71717 RepID=A0A4Y7TER4_COPMI|nr:hypothetical protein FA13DRAFT_1791282 [Coprinellus micaceus]
MSKEERKPSTRTYFQDGEVEWLFTKLPGYVESKATTNGAAAYVDSITSKFKTKFKDSPSMSFPRLENKLSQWFPNALRAKGKAEAALKGTVNVTAKDLDTNSQRKLQPWQAYLHLHKESTIEPEVEKRMVQYTGLSGKQKASKRFNIQNEVARELYNTASSEVRASVEVYWEKHANYQECDNDIQSRNVRFNDGVSRLPKTLATQTDALGKQTGWCTVMWSGGPHPQFHGELMSVLVADGQTKEGQSFQEWLNKNVKMKSQFERVLDGFMRQCYSKEDCDERALIPRDAESGGDDSDSDDEDRVRKAFKPIAAKDNSKTSHTSSDSDDSVSTSSDSSDSRPQNEDSDDKDKPQQKMSAGKGRKRQPAQLSEYEKERERNMQRNKAIIESLGLNKTSKELKSEKKVERKRKVEKEGETYVDGDKKREPGKKRPKRDTQEPARCSPSPTPSIVNTEPKKTPSPDPASKPDEEPASETEIDSAPKPTTESGGNSGTEPTGKSDAKSTNEEATSISSPSTTSNPNEGNAGSNTSATTAGSNTGVEPTTAKPAEDSDINPTGDAAGREGSQIPVDVNGELGSDDSGNDTEGDVEDASRNTSLPDWLLEHGTWSMIQAASLSRRWRALTRLYLQFEANTHQAKGRLATNGHPSQVSQWIALKGRAKSQAPNLAPKVFGTQLVAWWTSLQPDWRVNVPVDGDVSKLSREVPANETWARLNKGGSAGMYIIVLCISWWYKALDPDSTPPTELTALVRDVAFVLGSLIPGRSASLPGKRATAPAEGEEPASKRRRIKRIRGESVITD